MPRPPRKVFRRVSVVDCYDFYFLARETQIDTFHYAFSWPLLACRSIFVSHVRCWSDQDATCSKRHVNERSTKYRLCIHPVALVIIASSPHHRRLKNEMKLDKVSNVNACMCKACNVPIGRGYVKKYLRVYAPVSWHLLACRYVVWAPLRAFSTVFPSLSKYPSLCSSNIWWSIHKTIFIVGTEALRRKCSHHIFTRSFSLSFNSIMKPKL